MPFFSIIIPTYNRAHMIDVAIQSVLDQTSSNWELIIVDDGSTDDTKEVVEQFNDPRIKYVYQENQERSAARNRGILVSNGEWICFLDSDDEFPLERLERFKESIAIQENNKALYFTDITFQNGQEQQKISFPPVTSQNPLEYLLSNVIGTPQVCVYREILEEFNFNPELNNGEDLELWSRIQVKYPLIYLNTVPPVIAHEHVNRSVDLRNTNSALYRLNTLKLMFSQGHPANIVSSQLKKKLLADTQFNIAKHFMFNTERAEARRWIIRSLLTNWNNPQRKHRLFCLFSLLKGKTPAEYQ